MYDCVMNRVNGAIWGEIACADSADDWDQAMAEMGQNDEIRAAFAKPEHSNIRLTQNMSVWLVEIFTTKFKALVQLEHRILHELDSWSTDTHRECKAAIPQVPDDHIALYKSIECRIGKLRVLPTDSRQTRPTKYLPDGSLCDLPRRYPSFAAKLGGRLILSTDFRCLCGSGS
jgi:hypothetical protein